MSTNIEGKVVVITGASSGLGESTARPLAELGATVVLGARRKDRLDAIGKDITAKGRKAVAVTVDVTKREQVDALIQAALKAYGKVDVLVNNAGIMPIAPLAALKVDEWEKMIDIKTSAMCIWKLEMLAARAAWVAARIPYMQTEAYRFGNRIVDDWEGKVNSWPLDEGLIDYVSGSYGTDSPENELYAADVIANTSLTIGGKKLDTSKITITNFQPNLREQMLMQGQVDGVFGFVNTIRFSAKLMGVESQGMVLAAGDQDVSALLTTIEDVPLGSKIK